MHCFKNISIIVNIGFSIYISLYPVAEDGGGRHECFLSFGNTGQFTEYFLSIFFYKKCGWFLTRVSDLINWRYVFSSNNFKFTQADNPPPTPPISLSTLVRNAFPKGCGILDLSWAIQLIWRFRTIGTIDKDQTAFKRLATWRLVIIHYRAYYTESCRKGSYKTSKTLTQICLNLNIFISFKDNFIFFSIFIQTIFACFFFI